MHTLDSRFLSRTDCFSYRFATPGTFCYDVSPLPTPSTMDDFAVRVASRDGQSQQQHHVTVSRVDGALTASPARLDVALGDLVTWSADSSVGTGYAIRGTLGKAAVDSAALHDDSVFTHAFGLPGTYEWADANGSGLRGVVHVAEAKALGKAGNGHRSEWQRALARGTLIHVRGASAEPAEVSIQVGQTVFWAVQDAPGITITDVSLLR
ncbi:hypothetical protein ACQP00_28070 [Dactylosporangium sp. CS-047395]|uniref:hypothetical protein n=1 Tax=Dactylosporangium sp. CS-047395 TaxID=3239936 RepID=UPI003D92C03B